MHSVQPAPTPPEGVVVDDAAQNQSPQPLAGVAARGLLLFFLSTFIMKGATLVAQVVLGWKLDPKDFALFSTATAIAGFLMVCRDAGVKEYLIQGGAERYERIAGPAYWLAFWYNMVVAGIIAVLAIPIANYLHAPIMAPLLWALALALPLAAPGAVMATSLRVHLRFREFSTNATLVGVCRQFLSIIFALLGMGAMSLAWPATIAGAIETLVGFGSTRERFWSLPARVREWWGILRQTRWIMFASLANFAVDWGPFLLLPLVTSVAKPTQGRFYFGWSVTAQLGILLSWGLMLILTPVLARMNDNRERQAGASLRSLRALMILSSFGCLGLAATMDPLEQLLWHGKWELTVFPVVVLGVFFPWRITFGLTSSILQAQGRFKRYAVLTFIEGVGLTLAVTIAGLIDQRVDGLAWGAGAWLVLSRLVITLWVFRTLSIQRRALLGSTLPAWTIALLACAASIALDRIVLLPAADRFALAYTLESLARFLITGVVFVLVAGVLYRVVMRRHIEDALLLLPQRLHAPIRRVLLMR